MIPPRAKKNVTMRGGMPFARFKLIAAAFAVFAAAEAHAYIDPGAGAAIITAVLGAIGAIGYTARAWADKIKQFFARGKTNATPGENSGETAGAGEAETPGENKEP